MAKTRSVRPATGLATEPTWYKDAIVYELHVRAFCDSNGDGIGDFVGLCSKLDYLKDLGITAIWLLPFYPSPLRDDGYDIADYTSVHPSYGTLRDFRAFLREAHRRGLHVITELVVNHTSSDHPWFQRARRAPAGSRARDFYVWSQTPDLYPEARIIFQDFESSNWAWDPIAKAYYWHRFYSHQPDLNYDNPQVQRAVLDLADFWLGMGVDGVRLDAIPYLYQRDGTNCENLPETHAFLKKMRRHVDASYPNRMLLAEANQWPEDAVAYFGDDDECHMAFHFPVMPRMFMALQLEDRFPIIDILEQTPTIGPLSQWALFLRNHDELTLEMVTDEDRDYMYRVYARDPRARINLGIRRRLAPLLQSRRKLELLNGLLLSLPGTPVIYYGDEIAMGDNIYLGDRNGVRTPMQWSSDRNAGFSRANPQSLFLPVITDPEYHYEAVNVEAQQANSHSVLWWMKRLIALRKQHKAFGRGDIEFLHPDNSKVLAFVRTLEQERILVVANLSRFTQYVELDLSAYRGMVPRELFGQTEFPTVGELPYLLTLGPHAFYWFALESPRSAIDVETRHPEPKPIAVEGTWTAVFAERGRAALEARLPAYLSARRWFGGKARRIKSARITEVIQVPLGERVGTVTAVEVRYREGQPETYVLPLAFARGSQAEELSRKLVHAVVAPLHVRERRGTGKVTEGVLFDALADRVFSEALLKGMQRRRRFKGERGVLQTARTRAFKRLHGGAPSELEPRLGRAEQSNSSIIFGDRMILKLFRRIEAGTNPELEVGRFLTNQQRFANTPPLAASMEYVPAHGQPATVALLQGFVPNEGDAWGFTLDALGRYFEAVLARPRHDSPPEVPDGSPADNLDLEPPPVAIERIGPYLAHAELLGQRSAELHAALSAGGDDPAFAPERFTTLYQRSLYQSVRTRSARGFALLRKRARTLRPGVKDLAAQLLALEPEFKRRLRDVTSSKLDAWRIRTHGDFHLGQVLHTGSDFVIIDFEGEPARSIGERRFKRSPLRDVAGMLRSFHYIAASALGGEGVRRDDVILLEPWARYWHAWVSLAYLRSYVEHAAASRYLPRPGKGLAVLLDLFLLEKAVYEMEYELNNRPDWVHIPIQGLLGLLGPR